jgi:ADP-ribosyl-[dinitrogen reductase] hydrolase
MSGWFERFGFAEVGDGLLVGAYPVDADDVAALCEDVEYREGQRDALSAALETAGIEERRLPVPDYGHLAAEHIERAVGEVTQELEAGHRVYLHCRAGWQRSATVAAGVVALREGLDIGPALETVRERKPTAEPLEHQRADLVAWWDARLR